MKVNIIMEDLEGGSMSLGVVFDTDDENEIENSVSAKCAMMIAEAIKETSSDVVDLLAKKNLH